MAAAGSLARIAALATLGLTAVAFYIGVANWLFTRNLVSITPGMSILVIMALGTVAAIAAMLSGHKLQIGLIIESG